MNNSEMDTTDFGGIVIEQGNDAVGVGGLDGDFLGDLAFDGVIVKLAVVGIEQGDFIIYRVYMAAYAYGPVADESCLAGSEAANVGKVFAAAAHYNVRDKLLIRGVFFGLRAGDEVQDRWVEKDGKIALHVGCNTMK
jgi:hypothetical protein